jgi:serine protease AprX
MFDIEVRHVLRQQDGRSKEAGMRSSLRHGKRAKRRYLWRVLVLAVVVAAVLGKHGGATWGATSYDPSADPYSMQNITQGDGAQAWWQAGDTGQGVDVALIDTGVAPVPALSGQGKIVNGPDLSLESQNPSFQHLDTNGHGTFMAGIIGGNDGQAGGYRGVAPDSRILSVKVGDADGGVDVSQVIAAIDWVVQHRYDNGMNIRVINLSYGTNSSQSFLIDPLAFAVERAWKAGITVVTAAGNSGIGSGLADPAYDPWVISVGAADTEGTQSMSDDQPASFSAGASCSGTAAMGCRAPDLLAPGAHMQGLRDPGSYVDQNNPSAALGDQYFRGSGTSEAAAYVTGAIALLLQKYPQLTPDQVKQMLVESSDSLAGYSPLQQGAGELDLNALLADSPSRTYVFHLLSFGTGSLEAARGSNHLSLNGVVLQGSQDIFGQPFNSLRMALLEAAGSSWSGGVWNGSTWSGSTWSGNTWSGSTWSGNTWSGSTWSASTWSGNTWSGSTWSGNTWSGNSWSGSTWSGSTWSSSQWLGASWG